MVSSLPLKSESCKQLVKETREPIPAEPSSLERYDYQYERNGVANLFMFFEPLIGWRQVEVTNQRTAIDYAHQMKYLVDERHPMADKIGVIQDQLNTHVRASLYKTFEPIEVKIRLASIGVSRFLLNTAVGEAAPPKGVDPMSDC